MHEVDPLSSLCKCGDMISIISKPDDLGGARTRRLPATRGALTVRGLGLPGKPITLPVPILPALRSIGRALFAVETSQVVDTQHQLRLEFSLKCICVETTVVVDTLRPARRRTYALCVTVHWQWTKGS